MLAHMTRFRSFAPAAVPALLLGSLALTACSDSLTPGSAERVSLSFAAAGPAATAAGTVAAVGGAGSTARVTVGSDEIVLTRVQLVMKEVELKLPDGVSTCGSSSSSSSGLDDSGHHSSGSDDSSDDCDEIEQGPVLVELPLGGEAVTSFDVSVPAGSYRELELKLDKPDDDTQRDRAFAASHPELSRASVRVEGTYNGRAFVYTSRVRSEMELEFSPPIVVDAAGTNVTVRIDVTGWFKSSSGALIDPQSANAGGANEATVAANIRASFMAFGDDDRDGRSDDGSDDHGRNGGHGSDDN
ncbi:MAG TPA: hypothetical protein VKA84_21650 [Gemmatimonadaceae bacterium]|nr:hypothetical protein [Gemmatimonadaceae bacterium]